MNETLMTIVGNVVDDPRRRETRNGHAVTNFRVASTSRRYDREQERFVDSGTLFITVTCWRSLADNVDKSIRKGHPVVVFGRYYMREYRVEEQVRTAYELEAIAVGHDLTRGTTQFTRVYRSPAPTAVVVRDDDGVPIDDSDHWLNLGKPTPLDAGDVGEAGRDEVARPAAVERDLAVAS